MVSMPQVNSRDHFRLHSGDDGAGIDRYKESTAGLLMHLQHGVDAA